MSFELAGGPYAVTAARLALADLDSVVDASTAFDVRLLVSELVTNSVQHAAVSAEDSIRLRVGIQGDHVRVEVLDSGPGFDPPEPFPDAETDSGWGLFLVNQLADRWGVNRDEDSCVWFEIDRSKETAGADAA
jgi:anti-sigma regulatory factor (Ser/Thr protein kinase)